MIDWLMEMFRNVGQWLMNLLPQSPFRPFIDNLQLPQYMAWLNWFFPIHEILLVMTGWLAAIALFYAYSIIMRWVKVIGS